MQLPFVLQSAETMKAAVAYLEPHMEKQDDGGKGTLVIGTVKGDVHDIGKNLVDIILTNNGYEVHNIGIKAPLQSFVDKAKEVEADAVGMSGLLVKSTIIMRENLQEMNTLGLAEVPVLLGGAALTRTYVERDLREVYEGRRLLRQGRVRGSARHGRAHGGQARRHARPRVRPRARAAATSRAAAKPTVDPDEPVATSSDVATDVPVFTPPFLGARVAKGIALDEIQTYVNETALFRNQWQFRPDKAINETDDEFRVRLRPQLREELLKAQAEGLLYPAVVWGYFPVNSDGNDLVVWTDDERRTEQVRFSFPRQRKDRHLCIADFFRSVSSGEADYAGFQVVDDGRTRDRARARAVRSRSLHRVPPPARALGRDDRGTGRVLAPPHPRGVGLRRRGRTDGAGAVPPAVPRLALLVGLSRLPGPRGPGAARRRCSTSRASASPSPRSSSSTPSRAPRRSSCPTPRRSTTSPERRGRPVVVQSAVASTTNSL